MQCSYVLVLACDLSSDGTQLGPHTIARLKRGLEYWKNTDEKLVLAASMSPRHPNQPHIMAVMMAQWLHEHGCVDVCILCAETFRTKGEVNEFLKLDGAKGIISDALHLKRTKALIRRTHGKRVAEQLLYICTEESAMTEKGARMEPLKLLYARYFPLWLDDATWRFVTWCTVKTGWNLSY